MDIFDKFKPTMARRSAVLAAGRNPFGLTVERVLSPTVGIIEGRETILVGTNNYLGLSFDPACIDAALQATKEDGTGTTGSRIANGSFGRHVRLEEAFRRFFGKGHAIVFSTGYQANLATIAGLAGEGDTILADSDSHASIWDGCRLAAAETVVFRHNDPDHLDRRLARLKDKGGAKLIVVEGLYSILGDTAPLKEFVAVKRRHPGSYLLVDEAHSFGVFGEKGRGVAEAEGVEDGVDFVVGTFSKSLAGIGGFAVSDHAGLELLRVASRPYMFTASPNPAAMASVTEALHQIERRPELRARIWANAKRLHDGLEQLGFTLAAPLSPVIAIRLPDEATAVRAWNLLIDAGVYVNLALPPGTPNGACLLRCSLSAAHEPDQIDEVLRRFETMRDRLEMQAAAE
ncbi:MAG: aminotransferase class I/II-fold pyridoxal phosphate-dependent enzyme [Geminicoccaceae bacterium]|nr:aminotransferase class I/II-fold pyridoxal phosphate-dependent enzyme [Geminicoccaceae bacterium]